MSLQLIIPCPHCGSSDIQLVPYGEITGLALSGVVGGVLAATKLLPKHPLALCLGILGSVVVCCIEGRELGHRVDATILRRYQCGDCGKNFNL